MKRLRIAMFHASLPAVHRKIGGVEAAVHRLADTLARDASLDVTVFSCDEKPRGALYGHRRIFPSALRSRLLRLLLLPAFLNFLDFRAFDVVHTHGDDWFWLRRRVPTVRTMHGSALREAQNTTLLRRKLIQYLVYPLERLSTWLATRSVAVGRDTQHLYRCDEIIGNSVDLGCFKPQRKAPFPLIAFIGLWSGRKRGSFAFSIFLERVLPRFPDAQLHMISDTAQSHPNVVLHEHPDDATVAALLASAWAFCYPSTYEGFGIPYIEAMAAGTAIAATRNSGAFEVLAGGEYGFICEDRDFGDQLIELLDCPETRCRFAAKGIERAKTFGADAIAARYLEVYRGVAQC